MRRRFAKVLNTVFLYLIHFPYLIGCAFVIKIKYKTPDERFCMWSEMGEPNIYKLDMSLMKLLDKVEGKGHHWADNYNAKFSLAGLNKGE